jgi:hypothetical protein
VLPYRSDRRFADREEGPDEVEPPRLSCLTFARSLRLAISPLLFPFSDAEIVGHYKGTTPTTIAMHATKRVPGASQPCRNLFDLSQILAWLAKERRDVQEQLEWREKIPELLVPLMN